mmetsp:Transcript_16916/g.43742  ORF Transcript_16916/g.43742 Transcript_16916/m.43742 type:complete len:118 (+) Transcript_16916:3-356(+)
MAGGEGSEPIVPSSFVPPELNPRDKGRKGQRAGDIGWGSNQPFESVLPNFPRREGEFSKAIADPANQFVKLSGDLHFDRKVGDRVPTVNSKGFGYHVSSPHYKEVTKRYNESIRKPS